MQVDTHTHLGTGEVLDTADESEPLQFQDAYVYPLALVEPVTANSAPSVNPSLLKAVSPFPDSVVSAFVKLENS